MQESIGNLINFAIRAGKYALGESALNDARKGKAKLVLIAKNTSDSNKKRWIDKFTYCKVPCEIYGTKEELGFLLHKDAIAVLSINEAHIAREIKKLIKEEELNGIQKE